MASETSLDFGTVRKPHRLLSRHDLILGVIPLAFGSALLAAVASSLRVEHTLLVAATVGVVVILEALFRNPPRSGTADN